MITAIFASTLLAPAPLVEGKTLTVPGPAGGYDYLIADAKNHRIIAAHSRVGGLSVVDTQTMEAKEVPGPKCNGVVTAGKFIFAAGPDKKLCVYDRVTLELAKTVDLAGPGDAMAYDSTDKTVYVDEDDGTHEWVFDASTAELKATVDIHEGPEWIAYDKGTDRVYQNIKTNNTLQVVDPASHKVEKEFALPGLESAHGMAIDGKAGVAFDTGKNSMMILVDLKTGNCLQTVAIAKGVDQIAYDRGNHRIYSACSGTISVTEFRDGKLFPLGDIAAAPGVHTIAVDLATHDVWVAYADKQHSYLRQFKAN